jgi:hypothetical protein
MLTDASDPAIMAIGETGFNQEEGLRPNHPVHHRHNIQTTSPTATTPSANCLFRQSSNRIGAASWKHDTRFGSGVDTAGAEHEPKLAPNTDAFGTTQNSAEFYRRRPTS